MQSAVAAAVPTRRPTSSVIPGCYPGCRGGDTRTGARPTTEAGTELLLGSLTGDHLANGAVTPGKITPVVQSSNGSGWVPLVSPQAVGATAVPVSPNSLVMVSGQVQLRRDCSPCVPNVEHVVRYQVVRDGAPIGPQYRLELSAEHRFDVASVSLLDSGFNSAGPATYGIRVQAESSAAGVDMVATDAVLTAQVLGGQ